MRDVSIQPSSTLAGTGRFGYLMALYTENYLRFERLFQLQRHNADHWQSSIDDGLDIHLHIVERHRYTTGLRLTYDLPDPVTGEPDPSAHLRIYHDARLIEVTHCYLGQRWQDVLGFNPGLSALIGHRLRMNTFLGKWLDLLSGLGHSAFTLQAGTHNPQMCGRDEEAYSKTSAS